MLIVNGLQSHEINIDFTNLYTISYIVIDGEKSTSASTTYASRGWKVGIFEYDAESGWESLVYWCEDGQVLDWG